MKKLIVLFISLFMGMSVAMAAPSGPGTGEIRAHGGLASEAHKTFRLVRFAPQTSTPNPYLTGLAKDSIVVWDITADDGVTIIGSDISGDSAVAGVIVVAVVSRDSTGTGAYSAQDDIGQVNWTWLQTYGLSQVDMATGYSASAGDALGTALTDAGTQVSALGGAGKFIPDTINSNANGNAGFFIDAATSGATDVQVFIKAE